MLARRLTLALSITLALAGCRREPAHADVRNEVPTPPPRAAQPTEARVVAANRDPAAVDGPDLALAGTALVNRGAYIPPQCWTRTKDADGSTHDPCYACHQESQEPNYVDDADLQLSYAFPEPMLANPWTNLTRDRSAEVATISDDAILAYVREDNYAGHGEAPSLAARLGDVPRGWDVDGDGRFRGFVPDASFAFDGKGFDHDASGTPSGWRVFAYYPFLGTFFPTNGSTDDVLIRLPSAFRTRDDGTYDERVYETNLAIVESLVRRIDVAIAPTNEHALDVDLDRDGRLGTARRVVFAFDPAHQRTMSFVGAAKAAQASGAIQVGAGLFPVGTEFLHSVRYLDVDDTGRVRMARRMKELRYARKTSFVTYGQLHQRALREAREDRESPDRLREISGDAEHGVSNGLGWVYQGFIEDRRGELRPQTFEESVACVGCHGGIGATTDGIFSFARRLPASTFQAGWFHPTQHGLEGVRDPIRADGRPEYATYLRANGGADELRSNEEARRRFFRDDGKEIAAAFAGLARDVTTLLLPSRERALALSKAYLAIVRAQTFREGRDATITPAANVLRRAEPDAPTGIVTAIPGPGSLASR